VYDYGVKKDVENLPQLQEAMTGIIDNYHHVQQDILETFVDGGQLRQLAETNLLPIGKRIPGPFEPPIYTPRLWKHWAAQRPTIRWHRFAMICPSRGPKSSSRESRTHVDIV